MAKRDKNIPEKKKRQSARVPKLETLGKYQIEKEIGAGGMGAVFLARDTTLNRLAALKILPRDKAENPVLVKRFKAEGQAAAHLRHENIVSVYDAGEEDGYLYIALEYVEGTDLHNLINKRKRIPVRRSLEIITEVTKALAHAYQQGIVHRDIKPANILIRLDGVVKLTDLGLARSIDDNTETSITRAGTTVGTVDYMAPEQARDSKAADIRSDLYSLGCTWYHMLTGRAPYSEGSLTNKLAAHATTPPPDPRELNELVPEGMVAIIQRMMAKPQSERYQTPEDLLEDLKNSNLKRSNVDNNVLEALANDESDDGQTIRETKTNQSSDSSEFQMNQFMPDYKSQAEDHEDESSSRLSTSFDLQELAAEVENESETTVPVIKRSPKPVKKSVASEAAPYVEEEHVETRRSASQPETGSVISDSAMKTRQAKRSRKQEKSVESRKQAKQTPQKSKTARKQPAKASRPSRSSRKTTPVAVDGAAAPENQIAVNYKQIAMIIGGAIILILLVWWGINALTSSTPIQRGSGSNPFGTTGENPQGNQNDSVKQDSSESDHAENSADEMPSELKVEVSENKSANQSAAQTKQVSNQWQNVSVRGEEKKHLPEWGSGFTALVGPNRSKMDLKLPVLKVAKDNTGAGVYGKLNDAIKAVTSKGAVIRLFGQGPFLLNPQQLQNSSQLIIMADSEQNPVVVIQANDELVKQSEFDLISFSSGVLRFQGIHFLFDVSKVPGTGICNVFGIKQADLTFQNSSFSLTGTTQRQIRLINSSGSLRMNAGRPQGESRIFLENSVITGSRLETIHIDQPYIDVLISNCFISTTGVPSLELESLKNIYKEDSIWGERKVPRTVRIFSSTLLSDRSVFELNGPSESKDKKQSVEATGKSSKPITFKNQAEIVVVNSVLIGSPKNQQSSMLSLINWPQDQLRKESKNRFSGLKFELESTLLWGWPLYLSSTKSDKSQNVFQIDSHRTWQQSWGEIVQSAAFNTDLPSELNELRGPVFVRPLLDFSKQKAVYAISEGGVIAGCDPAVLSSLSPGRLNRIQAYLSKPQVKQDIRDVFAKAKSVSFDMTKGDLSAFLRSSAISGPTKVIISGQGTCYTSPLLIENKQVRLEFQPNKGERTIVELKLLSPLSTKPPRNQKIAGISSFITLRNSTLDLVGGNFQISAERKGVVPKHFLVCNNSKLALDQCALHAILVNDRRFQSVVYVESSDTGKPEQILIDHSFLAASGTIVESRASRLSLDVQSSLLLSMKDIFAFEMQKSVSPSVQVSLNQSTFASGETVFALKQTSGDKSAGDSAARIFADESIFMPAPATSAARSVFSKSASLFSIPQTLREKKPIQWWGNANGFMVERLNLLDKSNTNSQKTAAGFSKEMAMLFGAEADQGALAVSGGIMLLEQKLPPLVKIKSSHFELLPTCKAARWSGLKKHIGADPVALEKMILGSGQDSKKTERIKRRF
ncbi:serine/threonine-protein kinase [uncultured Gimesia sp.]|uniref:serine/threonine protein kinase n=1 Tax=uncultured Gimesia sp. TaxID=1678688 RepID=UPI0026309E30|nr:serine/threonine-protein kinase [uncultured Gimesia sp.]